MNERMNAYGAKEEEIKQQNTPHTRNEAGKPSKNFLLSLQNLVYCRNNNVMKATMTIGLLRICEKQTKFTVHTERQRRRKRTKTIITIIMKIKWQKRNEMHLGLPVECVMFIRLQWFCTILQPTEWVKCILKSYLCCCCCSLATCIHSPDNKLMMTNPESNYHLS